MNTQIYRYLLFAVFTVSGFAGLIHESIWSHYLKLFLGHAAYAQVLVLGIFMGGMAIGAWMAARMMRNWTNLLLAYAIVEAIVGVLALLFHPVFTNSLELAYGLFGIVDSPFLIASIKWLLSAALILPQSILLGATFPLMSGAIIRLDPEGSGKTLAGLYFTNSFGAAIGVLVSGFVLIKHVGLPGTVFTAGLLNILLALMVWLLAKSAPHGTAEQVADSGTRSLVNKRLFMLMLGAAMITGCASFIYEIGWIRMLSLVLGSSTHAFELMLSAFILGLAIGGFWIRRYIDRLRNPLLVLGWIQLAMAMLALATIPLYNSTFDMMKMSLVALEPNATGYTLFNFISHFITLLVMLPATICAGMTLPLITNILLQNNHGEKAIGQVYASNTAGAILGLAVAINIGLPILGLKFLISLGVVLDAALGVALLAWVAGSFRGRQPMTAGLGGLLVVVAIVSMTQFDTGKMASGLYRSKQIELSDTNDLKYYADGKTASVSISLVPSGIMSIRTNGKVDAGIQMLPDQPITGDEPTMVKVAAIPMALLPAAKNVAVIGFGSGLSTHTFLTNPEINRVDTIEIEPKMVVGAKEFRPINDKAFSDARSHIHIDDAKSYFTSSKTKYDVIVSEPSNPWVSGVANLFSKEFYRLVAQKLTPDGKLVQWLQLYQSNDRLVASVVKALKNTFPYFDFYTATGTDLIIVASMNDTNRNINGNIFEYDELQILLKRIGVMGVADLEANWTGDEVLIYPFYSALAVPENSDYFPYVDQNAVKARFLQTSASESLMFISGKLPLLQMLANTRRNDDILRQMTFTEFSPAANHRRAALNTYNLLTRREPYSTAALGKSNYGSAGGREKDILIIDAMLAQCQRFDKSQWLQSMLNVNPLLVAYLTTEELTNYWRFLENSKCYSLVSAQLAPWLDLFRALGEQDARKILAAVSDIKGELNSGMSNMHRSYLIAAEVLARYSLGEMDELIAVWQTNLKQGSFDANINGPITALVSAAIIQRKSIADTENLAAQDIR